MKIYITIDKILYLEAFTGPYMWSVTQGFLLNRKKPMPRSNWALDSGGFGELRKHGKYSFTEKQYLATVNRLNPELFFAMDWMCEPTVLKKTGLSVKDHQMKTTENILAIKVLNERQGSAFRGASSKLRTYSEFAGVIQGWSLDDYLFHIDQLKDHDCITPIMGIGSICRRHKEEEIFEIIKTIKQELPNTKLHGFGVKTSVLKKFPNVINLLDSIDSAAWGWMTGCWKAIGREKNPFISKFSERLNRLTIEGSSIFSVRTDKGYPELQDNHYRATSSAESCDNCLVPTTS